MYNPAAFQHNPYADNLIMNSNNQFHNLANGLNNNAFPNNNFAPINNNNNNLPFSNPANFAPNYAHNGNTSNNFPIMDNNNNMNHAAYNNNMVPNANAAIGEFNNANSAVLNNYPINNGNHNSNNIPLLPPQNINNSYASSGLQSNLANNALQLVNPNQQSGNLFDNMGTDDNKKKLNDEYMKSLLEQIEIRKSKKTKF
jgi:hypothetical protein